MAKKTVILVMLILLGLGVNAQIVTTSPPDTSEATNKPNKAEPQARKFKRPKFFDHTYVGGGLGIQFGAATRIEISPIIAYEVGRVFMAGIGFSYLYARDRYTNNVTGQTIIYQNNMYGGRIFARVIPIRNVLSNGDGFFIHGEFEMLNLEAPYSSSTVIPERYTVPGYIAGLGYQQAIGRRSFTYLSVLWNFNTDTPQDRPYPYYNPLIRFGFLIGL